MKKHHTTWLIWTLYMDVVLNTHATWFNLNKKTTALLFVSWFGLVYKKQYTTAKRSKTGCTRLCQLHPKRIKTDRTNNPHGCSLVWHTSTTIHKILHWSDHLYWSRAFTAPHCANGLILFKVMHTLCIYIYPWYNGGRLVWLWKCINLRLKPRLQKQS